ncbi:MAG: FtsX-like permease family protein, partial [Crenarchaeota archaeon]|nr:FtsX-like permease family protein [Thermoproteota archaeon]
MLRYTIKNMLEKKGRFFLLLFSIIICVMLLVISLGIVDVLLDGNRRIATIASDGKDICIHSKTNDVFFSENDINNKGVDNLEGELFFNSVFVYDGKNSNVNLRGKKDLNYPLASGKKPNSSNPECIISERIANEFDFNLNDNLEILLNGEVIRLQIVAIGKTNSVFYSDQSSNFTILVSYEYMESLLGVEGKYNYATATVSGSSVDDAVDEFNETNDKVTAVSLIDESMAASDQSLESALYMMLCIVFVISCIIISGTFKLIINERIGIIGTFLSQGATKKKIERFLLFEGAMYGGIGSVFGILFGEIILKMISYNMSPLAKYDIHDSYKVNCGHMVVGFLFAICLSMISVWFPVRKIRKFNAKDVILGRFENTDKRNRYLLLTLGVVLFVIGVIGCFVNNANSAGVYLFFIIALWVGVILAVPSLVLLFNDILIKAFRNRANIYMALKNINTSSLLKSNILMLTLSFSAVMILLFVGNSMVSTTADAYEELDYDYSIGNIIDSNSKESTTDIIIKNLNNIDAIDKESINPIGMVEGKMCDKNVIVQGVDLKEFERYNHYLELDNEKNSKYYKKLDSSDYNIIITSTISKLIG